jgi:hypothetical protein
VKPASWSPAIPRGAAAVEAWKRLDRRTRRDLLRSATAHPDPVVAAVAVGYARTILGHRWWTRSLWLIPTFAVGAVVETAITAWWHTVLIPVLIPLILAAVMIERMVRLPWFKLAVVRMENANAPSLLAAEGAAPQGSRTESVLAAGPGESFTVGYDGKALVRLYGGAAVIAVLAVTVTLIIGNPIFWIPMTVLMGVLTLAMAYNAIRWLRPRRPIAVLDGQGIWFPPLDLRVGWREVTEIRVLPLRAMPSSRPRHRVVAFIPADAEQLLGRFPGGRQARAGRRGLTYYGSPLTLPDQVLNRSAEEIAAAAQALAAVPVRRFSG